MSWMERIDKLKRDYTDKYVVVDERRPELRRFRGQTGQVKTVNMNGRALVEFDAHMNIGWYDIALDFLKVVDRPKAKSEETKEKPKAPPKPKPAPSAGAESSGRPLSPLELARMQGPAKKGDAKGDATKTPAASSPEKTPKTTAEILAASRVKRGAATATAASKPADRSTLSTADILAAARGGQKTAGATEKPPESTSEKTPATKPATKESAPAAEPPPAVQLDRSKLSTADILAAARGGQKTAGATEKPPEGTSEKTPATKPAPATKESAPAAEPTPAVQSDRSKMSTADILAAARGGQKTAVAPEKPSTSNITESSATEEVPDELLVASSGKQPGSLATAQEIAAEAPEEVSPPSTQPSSDSASASAADLPTDIDGKIAWCRAHDGK